MPAATTYSAARIIALRKIIPATAVTRPYTDAYLKAFDQFADALFRHACLRLPDRERARDLTQDTFIKAWDYVAAGNEVREWKSFLYRVLHNLIIDEYRKTHELSLDVLVEEGVAETAAIEELPGRREREDAFDEARAIEYVRALIYELPEPHRGALVLRYVDGLTPREVGRALEISENAAAVRIHRALGRLRVLCEERNINV